MTRFQMNVSSKLRRFAGFKGLLRFVVVAVVVVFEWEPVVVVVVRAQPVERGLLAERARPAELGQPAERE